MMARRTTHSVGHVSFAFSFAVLNAPQPASRMEEPTAGIPD
ncbi:hypothetical protein [Aminobacter anthyllidis]|nr:hypothetical protein [Aminobacter anthyllidis]